MGEMLARRFDVGPTGIADAAEEKKANVESYWNFITVGFLKSVVCACRANQTLAPLVYQLLDIQ